MYSCSNIRRIFVICTLYFVSHTSGQCPSKEWRHFRTKCFLAQSALRTFEETQKFCSKHESSLTLIESSEENKFLKEKVLKPNSAYFVGAELIKEETANYRWHDRRPLKFTNWKVGEPNDLTANCSRVLIRSDGLWEDVPCVKLLKAFALCQTWSSLNDQIVTNKANKENTTLGIIDSILKMDQKTSENFLKLEKQVDGIMNLQTELMRANETITDEVNAINARIEYINQTLLGALTEIEVLREANNTSKANDDWKVVIDDRLGQLEDRLNRYFALQTLTANQTTSKPGNYSLDQLLDLYKADAEIQDQVFKLRQTLGEMARNSSQNQVNKIELRRLEAKINQVAGYQKTSDAMNAKSSKAIINAINKTVQNADREFEKLRKVDESILNEFKLHKQAINQTVEIIMDKVENELILHMSGSPADVDGVESESSQLLMRQLKKLNESLIHIRKELVNLRNLDALNSEELSVLRNKLSLYERDNLRDKELLEKKILELDESNRTLRAGLGSNTSIVISVFTLCFLFFFVVFTSVIICTRSKLQRQRAVTTKKGNEAAYETALLQ